MADDLMRALAERAVKNPKGLNPLFVARMRKWLEQHPRKAA